jgi:acetyltransferase
MNLEKFFDPKSVAVIGASSDPKKVGFALVSNLLDGKKREVYPVTLTEKEILGMPAFTSILNVPNDVDLAIIAVKADVVPQVLSDCGKKKIPNVIIISSGFKEMGTLGRELEDNIVGIAKENGINLLGPNCLGVIDTGNDLNATFSAQKPLVGNIAFLSQSGALGTAMIDWAIGEGIGFSKFISLGNEAQLNEIDFLKYLESDPDTEAIVMYLENINNGQEFMKILSKITLQKPVVIIKAGMGSHGNLAAMSHTGALAPQASVFISACKQAGAVTTSSLRGVFNILKILSQVKNINKPIQRLIILTNGGGPSVIAADLVDRSHSLSLSELSNDTKESLRKILPTMAAIGNPIDIIGDALAERYDKTLDILCKLENVDGIIVILTPQMMTEAEATAKVLAKYKEKKKIFPVFIGGHSILAGRAALIDSGMVHFTFPKDVIESLDHLARGAAKIKSSPDHHRGSVSSTLTEGEMMNFKDMINLLSQYNISISGKFVNRKEDLENALGECGNGPYVMKAIAGAIIHKTEVGAIKINISNLAEASMVWEELWQVIASARPSHEATAGEEGILVQQMVGGPAFAKASAGTREVIIGIKRDNTFGPTVLFGLGGIFAEAIKDISLRIAPIKKDEALKMMHEIKGVKILEGLRAEPPVNFDILADILINLSRLALEHPEIKEIDLNPVMATDTSATIVDARIMI